MLYITTTRLMLESERAVRERADSDEELPRRVCSQLLGHGPRYSEWHSRHEIQMRAVADARRRDPQVLKLRAIAIHQVHRTAVVNYLRQGRIVGAARDQTLSLFHGVSDPRNAALAEHHDYLLAASTQFCAHDLLDLIGDREGCDLLRSYELAYGQYFALFCDRTRALQTGATYLLGSLVPEVKVAADRLRLRIVGTHLTATDPKRAAAIVGRSSSLLERPRQLEHFEITASPAHEPLARPANLPAIARTAR